MEKSESVKKGIWGEEIASRYLQKKGYTIIKRNFRSYFGEIDIIAFENLTETVVFVEVKLRKTNSLVPVCETVTERKKIKIRKTAELFLSFFAKDYKNIRFDFIGIEEKNGEFKIRHLENAF